MATFRFSLVAPERELYSGMVDQVDAPGAEGDMGVLAGHEPLMTTLRPGTVVVTAGGAKRVFTVEGGFADITPESFTLLADGASEATVQ